MVDLSMNSIFCGDCENILRNFPDNCVDLIVTSPPYADSRKKTYGGIKANNYVNWFLPKAEEFYRVLKPTGTFILNIKEKTVNSERHTYVLELILSLKKMGWLWTEEFIWHKKNSFPGKWPNRFRDAWERCLQFNKNKNFNMYQDAEKIPIGSWAETRLKRISNTDKIRDESKVKSGFGKKVANWVDKKTVYPTNVLHLATECTNKNHSAAFPISLPEWFIKLFTQPNNVVLDPFLGSGTTAIAAKKMGRQYLGIELDKKYYQVAKKYLQSQDSKNETIDIFEVNSKKRVEQSVVIYI